jgi:hypothetical protein
VYRYYSDSSLKKQRLVVVCLVVKMTALFSKAVALAALSSLLLVSYAAGARPGNFSASDFTADPNWEAARATWYGAPTGAGPMDDGTYTSMYICGVAILSAIVYLTLYLRW